MNKEEYLRIAFKEIREKNLQEPIEIRPGQVIHNLEKYLKGISQYYLGTKKPICDLFYDKIEELRKFEQ